MKSVISIGTETKRAIEHSHLSAALLTVSVSKNHKGYICAVLTVHGVTVGQGNAATVEGALANLEEELQRKNHDEK